MHEIITRIPPLVAHDVSLYLVYLLRLQSGKLQRMNLLRASLNKLFLCGVGMYMQRGEKLELGKNFTRVQGHLFAAALKYLQAPRARG